MPGTTLLPPSVSETLPNTNYSHTRDTIDIVLFAIENMNKTAGLTMGEIVDSVNFLIEKVRSQPVINVDVLMQLSDCLHRATVRRCTIANETRIANVLNSIFIEYCNEFQNDEDEEPSSFHCSSVILVIANELDTITRAAAFSLQSLQEIVKETRLISFDGYSSASRRISL